MILDDPLFPARDWVDRDARAKAEATPLAGSAASRNVRGTVAALEHWTRGGTFHPYGLSSLDALLAEDYEMADALRDLHDFPGYLRIEGTLRSGGQRGMWWTVWFDRAGIPEARGGCSGYSTVEDAAYQALHLIEQEEREAYLERLVVGLA